MNKVTNRAELTFGEKLKDLIVKHGKTQKQIASEIGISEPSLSNYVNFDGPIEVFGIRNKTLLKITEYFNVPNDYFNNNKLREEKLHKRKIMESCNDVQKQNEQSCNNSLITEKVSIHNDLNDIFENAIDKHGFSRHKPIPN